VKNGLDDLLCKRYPEIFKDRKGSPGDTGMYSGFCCGDGWFDIIDRLCADITERVVAGEAEPVVAMQVKSKAGFLRFRFKGEFGVETNAPVRELIRVAQQLSERTCEECGRPDGVWYLGAVCASCGARR
jgi:hypothetical protein